MFVLVLAAEADETRQAITFLIVCLVGIAFLLALLTLWYWVFTSPKRRLAAASVETIAESPADEPELARSSILSESSDLLNQTLNGSDDSADVPDQRAEEPVLVPAEPVPHRIEVPERTPISDPPVPAACSTNGTETTSVPVGGIRKPVERRPTRAAATVRAIGSMSKPKPKPEPEQRPTPNHRPKVERAPEALSDDAWAAAMKSAFDKLHS